MSKNAPQEPVQNALLRKELHELGPRRYTTADRIERVAKYYYEKTGNGITFVHIIKEGIAKSKSQAQNTLKRFRNRDVLFTLENRRPQRYYPASIRSSIIEDKLKNTPLQPSGINEYSNSQAFDFDRIVEQTLEGYILPLLPDAPIEIHNIHLKIKINTDYYSESTLPSYNKNKGKHSEQIVGNYLVRFTMYSNGTIEIIIASSNNPFKLETEIDLGRLLAFLGEIRGCLKDILNDPHERVVPDIMIWEMTECDINKDIKVQDAFHMTGLKIQIKHVHHLLRLYFKARRRDTVFRVERSIRPKKSAITAIKEIFDANEKRK